MNRRLFLAGPALLLIPSGVQFGRFLLSENEIRLLENLNHEADDPELLALKRLMNQPGPAEAELQALNISVPFYEPDFDSFPDGPYKRQTHRFHYSHHYLEYVRRWQLAENREKAGNPDSEKNRWAVMAQLHAHYWRQFRMDSGGNIAEKMVEKIMGFIERGNGKPDWFVILENDGKLLPWVFQSNRPFVPDHCRILFSADLMPHAWRLDFSDIRAALSGLLQSVQPNIIKTLEHEVNWGHRIQNPASSEIPGFIPVTS